MSHSRRDFITGLTALTAAGMQLPSFAADSAIASGAGEGTDDFASYPGVYLDSASHHPLTRAAAGAIRDYVAGLETGHSASVSAEVRGKFAKLINADTDEISYAPSTSMGENLVTMALGIPARGGRIITDALHFIGSFYLYEQLGKQGMDIIVLPMQEDGSVSTLQYADALTDDTVLLAVSHVSWVNGFQHDLGALSELAHSVGARLYADIIQSAGNTPIDVKAMGIDFACCATYKWLMGDFGLAFLYADKQLVNELETPWYGYLQTRNFVTPDTHLYPFDPPGEPPYTSSRTGGVGGLFNGAFPPRMIEAGANASLDLLLTTGVEAIQAHRQPMIDALQRTLTARGFRPYTPEGTTSPIVSFIHENAQRLDEQLAATGVKISTYNDRFRISPSFFNTMNDIDKVIEVLGYA